MARHLVLSVLLLFAISINAQETKTFRVDSYVPEHFHDLRLSIDGNGRIGIYSSKGSYSYAEGFTRNRNTQLQSYFSPEVEYREATRDREIRILSDNYVCLSHNSDTYGDSASMDSYYYMRNSETHSHQTLFELNVFELCEMLVYQNNFFGSISGQLQGQSNQTLGAGNNSSSHDLEVREDSLVYERFEQATGTSYARYRYLSGALTIGIGYGRQYQGRYAATAIAMIDELRSKGLLAHEPSYDDMMLLTDLIYSYQNRHPVDYRILRIEGLSALLQFLQDRGITGNLGASGPFVIEDIYQYYPRMDRYFGARIRAGAGSEWSYSKSFSTESSETQSIIYRYEIQTPALIDTMHETSRNQRRSVHSTLMASPFLFTQIEFGRPAGMRWQYDANLLFRAYLLARTKSGTADIKYVDKYRANLSAAVTYFLGTRTNASLALTSRYDTFRESGDRYQYSELSTKIARGRQYLYNYEARLSLNYRVATPTTLTASAVYNGNDRRVAEGYGDYEWHHGFTLGFGFFHYIL